MRCFPRRCPRPLVVVKMAVAIGNWRSRNIRGEEVASPSLVREERHRIVEEERKVVAGVSIEEIWRDYETAKTLLAIAEATGNEEKARIQRERVELLENEMREAVMDENIVEDFGRWC